MENEKRQVSIFNIIGAGYGVLVLIILGISILSISRISFIDRNLAEINNVNSAKQRVTIDYRGSVHDRSISVRDVVLAENENDLQSYIAEIRQKEADYVDAKQRMQNNFISKNMLTDEEKVILDKINNTETAAMPLIQGIISDKQAGRNEDMVKKLNQVRPLFVDWLKYINEFINLEEAKNQAVTPVVTKSTSNFKFMMILNSIIALILGFSIAFFIIRYLLKLLGGDPQDASKSFNAISQGDLSHEIKTNKNNKDSMLSHIVFMQSHLRNVINNIQHSADELGRSTHVVADSSNQAQQAAEDQHTASMRSVEQIKIISAGTAKIAEIARQTEQNSEKTLELSKKGNEAMNNTTDAINKVSSTVLETAEKIKKLKEKSSEISGSAGLIAEVADQTNLLALNAAIEAARAGDHGKGFAVVADEVRKLAERTGDTTAQITNMITDIQKEIEVTVTAMEQTLPQVEKGLELAGITSDILNEIQKQATDSLTMAQDVTVSSTEQENGINTIQTYLAEMADMSSNTQNMMQENVREVEKLETISKQLKEETSFFKL
ncbi:MAG: methyl-accepting chemotaxis protein [Candidatus Mucispirillum faecigallinarum]|nr:methyl-accepting chemotaxis protein [Candidatus Mucispirillum faecigallinarum]